MAEEKDEEPIKRGPRGGRKHKPGRDHDRKSGASKQKRFAKKRKRQREAEADRVAEQWRVWDSLPEEVRRLRPDLEPESPRPTYGDP